MNITELRYLVAIRKWGSVSAAAKQLYAAQPNVSKALKNLEEEYGIRIFERSSTGMIPTEQGRRFIEQAARVLEEVDRLTEDAHHARERCAELRVMIPHATYASYAAVDFLKEAAGADQLRIHIREGGSMEALDFVLRRGYHLALLRYAAEDDDLLVAEAAYCALEDELQHYLDTYTRTHDYDEYHFDLDTIEHDPYVLLSIVCALHEGEWTLDEVRGTLQMLFDRQYILTEDVVVEVRYRTVTRTDSEGNNYDVEVPYNYYICYVTLENFNLSHLPVYIMGEETLSRYALYMATLGNRPDLFPSSPYVGKYTSKPPLHEIPEDYLADETFAAILKEAEKYVGYPYVWGGSSPSTSFDCSGFVSYVYNQCGWDFGRLGAQGLYNISARTSSPKPGDLVFFTGTYETPGISHVGIYVGDGWMLLCGDPISYANLNRSYWPSHLYAYGRLP